MRFYFNNNNQIDMPELVLGKRNYDKLGSITNVTDFIYEYQLMSADSISFTVHRETDNVPCRLWNEIRDRRLVWISEFQEWFEISVSTDENDTAIKIITGTSLCEAELSQVLMGNIEINTEDDIARDDYEVTKFYNPYNPNASLLHRITKVVPNYRIGHVDETLWDVQRNFSINGSTYLYDFLTGELCKEIGCIFIFDSTSRIINVYDLQSYCPSCNHRGDFSGECPKCGNTDIKYGYGEDTTIYIDNENLAESISLQPKSSEVKNCFKIIGGDDLITATIAAISPNGSNEIYMWSEEDIDDMSDSLKKKLELYNKLYNSKLKEVEQLNQNYYNLIDQKLYLESGMMPNIDINPSTTASIELSKLTSTNLSPVAVSNINTVSKLTASNAVLSMAKCLINSTVYKVTIVENSDSLTGRTWNGRFKLVNYSEENDCAESSTVVTVSINDNVDTFIKQKIEKTINRDDKYLVDLFDKEVSLSEFKKELKEYCLARLSSFSSAYQYVIDTLVESDCGNERIYGDLYNDLYVPYYNKWAAIDSEIKVRETEIERVKQQQETIEQRLGEISSELNMPKYFGSELYNELCSLRREDIYENSNYISDGLDNSQIFEKAKELKEIAISEASKASKTQWTLSASIYNLLAIPEFQPLISKFNGGNWLRIKIDDKIFRLRLVSFKFDYNNLKNLEVEFSDVTIGLNYASDLRNLFEKTNSISGSFSYVAHQAKQGEETSKSVNKILEEGLDAALVNIKSGINQDFLIDEHGILGRQWDDQSNNYSPKQSKWINNLFVFTKDNWLHAETALGEIQFTHPLTNLKVNDYGLLTKYVIAGTVIGSDIIGGNLYSSNYKNNNGQITGNHFDLIKSNFELADGKIIYKNNKLTLQGVTIEWSSSTAPSITDIEGLDGDLSALKTLNNALAESLGVNTTITEKSIISPYIGGGYLNIAGTYGRVVIDPNKLTNGSYIFRVSDNKDNTVIGIDNNGNAYFSGKIEAASGTIGGFKIGTSNINSYSKDDLSRVVIGSYDYDTNHNAILVQTRDSANDAFTSHFRVRYDGSVYADKVDLSGKITASSGSIGGFVISSSANTGTSVSGGHSYTTSLYEHSSDDNYEYEVGIKGDGNSSNNLALYVKRITKGASWSSATNRFYVTHSGKLYAQEAEIKGTISADSIISANKSSTVSLGSWTLNGNDLYNMYDGRGTGISTGGTNAIGVGFTNPNNWTDAPFRVTHEGKVFASNIEITGHGTSWNESSKIGVFQILQSGETRTVALGQVDGGTIYMGWNFTMAGEHWAWAIYLYGYGSSHLTKIYFGVKGDGTIFSP